MDEDAARGHATLGQILKQAKLEKQRREHIEVLKEAGIDPTKIMEEGSTRHLNELDIDAKIKGFMNKGAQEEKKWMLYPDSAFKSYWDIVITV